MATDQVGQQPPDHSRIAVPVKERAAVFRPVHRGGHELKVDGWLLYLDGVPRLGLFVYPVGLFVTKKIIQALDPQRFSNVVERRFSLELNFPLAEFNSKLSEDFGADSLSADVYRHPDANLQGEIYHYCFSRETEDTLVSRIRRDYMV